MAHSRIWESENSYCYYESSQLHSMIFTWEPKYANFSMDNFDFALGVYSLKYFQPSRYGRYSYQSTPGENCISLLKPRAFEGTKHFTRFENNRMFILYNFEKKLWDDVNRKNLMFSIDNALIAAKIKELQGFSRTKYMWPLSFSLETNTVKNILLLHGIELNNKHHF